MKRTILLFLNILIICLCFTSCEEEHVDVTKTCFAMDEYISNIEPQVDNYYTYSMGNGLFINTIYSQTGSYFITTSSGKLLEICIEQNSYAIYKDCKETGKLILPIEFNIDGNYFIFNVN